MKTGVLRAASIALSAVLVGCDHASKLAAQTRLGGRIVDIIPGVLDVQYTENRNVAFSLLHEVASPSTALFLTAFGVLALMFILAVWWRRANSSFESFGFALVLAGALGNVIDRASFGYVIDFIHVHHWPVFNIADAAIVIGMGVLTVSKMRTYKPAK